jgi:Thermolysin metallopeptidase, alpha-helical domain
MPQLIPDLTAARRTAAALAALAGLVVPSAADAQNPSAWTRQLSPGLSARQLDLPRDAPARALARAALRRTAGRLGLRASLRGVRLERDLRVPGRAGARDLRLLRFHQTVAGVRVVWSQIDLTIAGGRVGSISSTVVPLRPRAVLGPRRVSRQRALAIARRAVPGPEQALRPLAVAYAGNPKRARPPRRAWLVETMAAAELGRGEDSPRPLCIVVDAESGSVISRWRGTAGHPDRGASARATGPRVAQAAVRRQVLRVYDDAAPGTPPYATYETGGDPFGGRAWPVATGAMFLRPRNATLDRLTHNALNATRTVCVVRTYCGRLGYRRNNSTSSFLHWDVIGTVTGVSHMNRTSLNVYITRADTVPLTSFNDVVAHEMGHVTDLVYAGDRSATTYESREVGEALADMFAYDYDRGDATLGEETAFGVKLDWANPASRGNPAHMSGYVRTENRAVHLNSTILSHAYYLLVQSVGHPTAGNVLQYVPYQLSPNPTFREVKDAFVRMAAQLYPLGSVRAAAVTAFARVGLP